MAYLAIHYVIVCGDNDRIQQMLLAGSAMRIDLALSAHDHVLPDSSGYANPLSGSYRCYHSRYHMRRCSRRSQGYDIFVSQQRVRTVYPDYLQPSGISPLEVTVFPSRSLQNAGRA